MFNTIEELFLLLIPIAVFGYISIGVYLQWKKNKMMKIKYSNTYIDLLKLQMVWVDVNGYPTCNFLDHTVYILPCSEPIEHTYSLHYNHFDSVENYYSIEAAKAAAPEFLKTVLYELIGIIDLKLNEK